MLPTSLPLVHLVICLILATSSIIRFGVITFFSVKSVKHGYQVHSLPSTWFPSLLFPILGVVHQLTTYCQVALLVISYMQGNVPMAIVWGMVLLINLLKTDTKILRRHFQEKLREQKGPFTFRDALFWIAMAIYLIALYLSF